MGGAKQLINSKWREIVCVISRRGLGTWWIKMEGGSVRRNIALKLKEPASIPSVKTQPVGGE